MARRTGSADLPLHFGRVPPWLAARMASLGAVVCQAIVHHYGRDEFLRRLSHPFWFRSQQKTRRRYYDLWKRQAAAWVSASYWRSIPKPIFQMLSSSYVGN